MKRVPLLLICTFLISGCGQSDEVKAAELVRQSCAIGSTTVEKRESLIREAVSLDEKYRPYLIAWLKWQGGADEAIRAYETRGQAAGDLAYKEFKDNFTIQDSYC